MTIRGYLLVASISIVAELSTARAAEHLMKVGEVVLSNGGSTTSQYVELEDPGESFPNTYALALYDANGTKTAEQPLTVPSGTTRLFLATAQAQTDFAVTADAILTLSLPANGQLCFLEGAASRIHCLRWGTIVTPVQGTFGSNLGPAPGDGLSLQRSGGAYCVSTPTPDAANACPAVDAGPQPPIDAPSSTPDASTIDAPGGNPNNPPADDDGCSVGGGASWLGLAVLSLLVLRRRSSKR